MKDVKKLLRAGAVGWVVIAGATIALGQPKVEELYEQRASEYDKKLEEREVFASPAEVLSFMYNNDVELRLLDVRAERDFNLFHLKDAIFTPPEALSRWYGLRDKPNRLFIVMSNDETGAIEAWKHLTAMKVANVYVLEGGINNWLKTFGGAESIEGEPGQLRYRFDAALGSQHEMSRPSRHALEAHEFEKRVKLQTKARKGGGCG